VCNSDHKYISSSLKEILQSKIGCSENQVITFSDYMSTVLYYPDLGFYSNQLQKFGRQGHFFTASTIGSIFSSSIAKQILELFDFGIAKKNVLEIGAGSGDMAIGILKQIGNEISRFQILELNDRLISEQKSKVFSIIPEFFSKVEWVKELPSEFIGVILANEVLDAIPCDRILIDKNGSDIAGLGVGFQNGELIDKKYSLPIDVLAKIQSYGLEYDNYMTESNFQTDAFIKTLASTIKKGALLFIDYGCSHREYYSADRYSGRVRGFHNHKVFSSLYEYLGLMDITTDVNFTQVAESGISSGLDLIGYTNQGAFIINIMPDIISNIYSDSSVENVKLLHELQTLISPVEMGDVFKVMAFSKNIDQDDWIGFSSHDLSYRL